MLNDFMVKIFGLNWRSWALGLLGATGNIIVDYVRGTMDFRTFLVSAFIAVMGYIVKDAKVTGSPLNPRAQIIGELPPPLTPEAMKEIATIKAK